MTTPQMNDFLSEAVSRGCRVQVTVQDQSGDIVTIAVPKGQPTGTVVTSYFSSTGFRTLCAKFGITATEDPGVE